MGRTMSRRTLLGAAGLAAAGLATGCSKGLQDTSSTGGKTIKIGYVIPKTGALAVFGESNDYVLSVVKNALKGGITVNNTKYEIEIVEKDSQSSSARAAQVAGELINQ